MDDGRFVHSMFEKWGLSLLNRYPEGIGVITLPLPFIVSAMLGENNNGGNEIKNKQITLTSGYRFDG